MTTDPSQSPLIIETNAQHFCVITLNAPDKGNPLGRHLMETFMGTLDQIKNDPKMRGLIIQAKGKYFCTGAHLKEMKTAEHQSLAANEKDALALAHFFHAIDAFPKPTIAAIQGSAFGGGVGLIACCDIAVAHANVTFSFSEVKLGLIPAVISPYVLNKMGLSHTRRYFLTGEAFSAKDAKKIGLIHESVEAAQFPTTLTRLMDTFNQNGPQALAQTKALLRQTSHTPLTPTLLTKLANAIAKCRTTEEAQAGMAAFFNKIPPPWQP